MEDVNDIFIEIKEKVKHEKRIFENYMRDNTESVETLKNKLESLKKLCESENIYMQYVVQGANVTVSYCNLKRTKL